MSRNPGCAGFSNRLNKSDVPLKVKFRYGRGPKLDRFSLTKKPRRVGTTGLSSGLDRPIDVLLPALPEHSLHPAETFGKGPLRQRRNAESAIVQTWTARKLSPFSSLAYLPAPLFLGSLLLFSSCFVAFRSLRFLLAHPKMYGVKDNANDRGGDNNRYCGRPCAIGSNIRSGEAIFGVWAPC